MIKREASCPLCGARMSAMVILDAGSELLNPGLGVIAARCPHCQGYIELRPAAGKVDIGYGVEGASPRFEVAISLPFEGLTVERLENPPRLVVRGAGRAWEFGE